MWRCEAKPHPATNTVAIACDAVVVTVANKLDVVVGATVPPGVQKGGVGTTYAAMYRDVQPGCRCGCGGTIENTAMAIAG